MPEHIPEETVSWRGKTYLAGKPAQIPDDLAAALGLAEAPEAEAAEPDWVQRLHRDTEAIAAANPDSASDTLTAAVERLEELRLIYQVDGWKAIAAIAKPLGVTKHPDGWDSSLLLIIEQEFSPAIAKALAAEDAAE